MPATRDRARYGKLIGAMLSFHLAAERELRRFETEFSSRGLSMEGRYKAELLRLESRDLKSPSVTEPLIAFASAAHAAGSVYVMEGSTLGGLVIAKSVHTHLAHRSRYYGCYGGETAQRWRSTSKQLDGFTRDAGDMQAMVSGANMTFAALHAHLARSFACR